MNDDIKTFRSECLQFLVSLTCKIVERSPLKYAVVRNAKSIDPEIMCLTPQKAKKFFRSFVANLVQMKRVETSVGDSMYSEYKRYLEKVMKKNRELFMKFNKKTDRLDDFFFNKVCGLDEYPLLSKCIKMILVLIHGQAHVERGFNVNKSFLQPNLESVINESKDDI